ncbi:MAG: glycoside hydrolase family 28 [Opitutaceae bacterium]|jgi:polygalacturonase|nr:glycoside hydrolase family 28 [Opitutaceae bacterium]
MRISITETGAIASSPAINTRAIQRAIDRCADAGGGMVYCPPGIFLTGTLWLKNNITLHLDAGCTLLACADRREYNAPDCFPEQDVVAHQAANGTHLLIAYKCDNVTLAGRGTIDGNPSVFFNQGIITRDPQDPEREGSHEHYKLPGERPGQMLYFVGSTNVRLENVSLVNACFWSVYMLDCDCVKISGLTIRSDRRIPNSDGLHFNCCRNLLVDNCDIDTADDCIVLRGHYKVLGNADVPMENAIVSNCILRTRCCALRLGVGDGTLRDCLFANLVIRDTRTGISIWPAYSHRYPRGTDIDNIRFENIVMDVTTPVNLTLGAGARAAVGNIVFRGLSCRSTKPVYVIGEEAVRLSGIDFIDCVFRFLGDKAQSLFDAESCVVDAPWKTVANPPACGLFVRYANRVRFRNVRLDWTRAEGRRSESLCCIDCDDVSFDNVDSVDFYRMGIPSAFRLVRSSVSKPQLPPAARQRPGLAPPT